MPSNAPWLFRQALAFISDQVAHHPSTVLARVVQEIRAAAGEADRGG